jgi:hypothetical protein
VGANERPGFRVADVTGDPDDEGFFLEIACVESFDVLKADAAKAVGGAA